MAETKQKAPKDLIGFLDYYLVKNAPFAIPDGAKEWIVKYGPWITVVLMVLMLPVLFAALGLAAMLSPFAMMGGYGYASGFGVTTIFTLAIVVLEIMALPGLFARKMSGWTMLFYAELASLASGLVSAVMYSMSGLFSTLIGSVIGLYILFQIREKYTK